MKNYINASTIIPSATAAIVLLLSFATLVNADLVLGFGAVLALGLIAALEYRPSQKSLRGLYSRFRQTPPCNGAGAIRSRFFAPGDQLCRGLNALRRDRPV